MAPDAVPEASALGIQRGIEKGTGSLHSARLGAGQHRLIHLDAEIIVISLFAPAQERTIAESEFQNVRVSREQRRHLGVEERAFERMTVTEIVGGPLFPFHVV